MTEDWTLRNDSLSRVAASWIPPVAFVGGIAIAIAVSAITSDGVALFLASAAPTVSPVVAYGFAKSLRQLYGGVSAARLAAVALLGMGVGTWEALYVSAPPASGSAPPASLVLALLYIVYVVVVAPVAEEFLFQGYVQTMALRYGSMFSLVVAAAVGTAMHIGKEGPLIWYAALFAWFAYLRLKSNSLSTPTVAHIGISVGAVVGALVRVSVVSAWAR